MPDGAAIQMRWVGLENASTRIEGSAAWYAAPALTCEGGSKDSRNGSRAAPAATGNASASATAKNRAAVRSICRLLGRGSFGTPVPVSTGLTPLGVVAIKLAPMGADEYILATDTARDFVGAV